MEKGIGQYEVKDFFNGMPDSYGLFLAAGKLIRSLGPVKTETAKTHISFGAKRKFAWVWLPQLWIEKRPKASITLTFDNCRMLHGKKIESSVEPYPGRWTHHILITSPGELDDEIRLWLGEAYLLGGGMDFLKDTNVLKWRKKKERGFLAAGNAAGCGSAGEFHV